MSAVRKRQTFGIWLSSDGWEHDGVQISNLPNNHTELVVLGDVMVPGSFTARVDRADLPLVELDIAFVDGRFRCIQLRAIRRHESDFVEAQQLRRIRLVELVREAVGLATYLVFELYDEADVEVARDAFERLADLETTPVNLDDMRVGDFFRIPVLLPLLEGDKESHKAFLLLASQLLASSERLTRKGTATNEDVAQVYQRALGKREPVTDAIAEAFGWKRQTARNRIHAARRAGLLPETIPGRARA